MGRLLILLLLPLSVAGANWYVSPTATTGSGSFGDPWSIYVALTNIGSVVAGDTVSLRGGTYAGSGYFCTLSGTVNNPITIKAYPGESVHLIDGLDGILATTMNASTSPITIQNSEHWQPANVIGVDNEFIQLSATSGNATNWVVNRGWNGTTATSHSIGASVVVYGASIIDHGSYSNAVFQGFEISSPKSTNRVWTVGTNFAAGVNLGVGDKAVNLIIHDVAQPGVGAFVHVPGGFEVNGCVMWGIGMFDTTGGFNEYRGSGVYAQNEGGGGMASVKGCIFFRETTRGGKVFGETGPVKDFQFVNCVSAMNGISPLEIQSGSSATSNTWINGCFMWGTPALSYVSLSNLSEHFNNNVAVQCGISVQETTPLEVTNNVLFLMTNVIASQLTTAGNGYGTTHFAKSNLSLAWDYNTWNLGDLSSRDAFNFSTTDTNSGWTYFPNWQAISGCDAHSTCVTNWPTNYLKVKSLLLDYDSNRHFVAVVSTSGATNAVLDLSTNGFGNGDRWTLRDAQNYFTVIASGTYTSGTINLPLNLTNIAQLQGSVTNFVPQHTNVQYPGLFNAFVLDKVTTLGAFVYGGKLIKAVSSQ